MTHINLQIKNTIFIKSDNDNNIRKIQITDKYSQFVNLGRSNESWKKLYFRVFLVVGEPLSTTYVSWYLWIICNILTFDQSFS